MSTVLNLGVFPCANVHNHSFIFFSFPRTFLFWHWTTWNKSIRVGQSFKLSYTESCGESTTKYCFTFSPFFCFNVYENVTLKAFNLGSFLLKQKNISPRNFTVLFCAYPRHIFCLQSLWIPLNFNLHVSKGFT